MILETFLTNWHIVILFFLIAILYASVGFGGGSSYLAVLALTSLAFTQIRATALLCNIVVVLGNVYLYQKEKIYNWKKIIPLILFSIPLAFVGGYLKISKGFFYILLGITLLFAAITMWFNKKLKSTPSSDVSQTRNSVYGGVIGFLSGMVGIGGGIFLAPLLHLTNWDKPKKIAATASFFILVNSIAGLFGQITNPDFSLEWNLTMLLIITVFIGGHIGNKLSSKLLNPVQLKRATAILIAFISIKILYEQLTF